MKNTIAAGLVALAIGTAGNASAAELKLLISNGMKEAVQDLAPQFERATGHKLSIRYGTSAFLQRDMEAGENFDVTVVPVPSIEVAAKAGKLDTSTRSEIAHSRPCSIAFGGLPMFSRLGESTLASKRVKRAQRSCWRFFRNSIAPMSGSISIRPI